jgi:hypothetical protein
MAKAALTLKTAPAMPGRALRRKESEKALGV